MPSREGDPRRVTDGRVHGWGGSGQTRALGLGVAKRNSVLGAGLVLLVLDLILRLGKVIAFWKVCLGQSATRATAPVTMPAEWGALIFLYI